MTGRQHYPSPTFAEVRKGWAGWVGSHSARAWLKAGPAAVEERLGLLLTTYLEKKRQLRSFGVRPDTVHGEWQVVDEVRARRAARTMPRVRFQLLMVTCLFAGYYWYKVAWALYRRNNPTWAALELARFYDDVVPSLPSFLLIQRCEERGHGAKQWRTTLPILASFIRGQLRAANRHTGLPRSEEELVSFAYEAWRKTHAFRATTLASEVDRLWQEFKSTDTEYDHWRHLADKKGEPPKVVAGVQELFPHVLPDAPLDAAAGSLEDEDLEEFERQETLRQNSQHLKTWAEHAKFSSQQQMVYEADMRNNFNTVLGAQELRMKESTYRTQRARFITKLREISIIMLSRELSNKMSKNIA